MKSPLLKTQTIMNMRGRDSVKLLPNLKCKNVYGEQTFQMWMAFDHSLAGSSFKEMNDD